MNNGDTYTSFDGVRRVVSAPLGEMLRVTKAYLEQQKERTGSLLIFHDPTGKQVDFDFRGSVQEVLGRALPANKRSGPGRPRLGVTSREITLLPRHWLWLEAQPQGVSATLRRLVDEARKRESAEDRSRRTLEAADRFMLVMAGDFPGYEEASRALYNRDMARLEHYSAGWPLDVREYVLSRVREVAGEDPPSE